MVFAAVGFSALALTLVGLIVVRVYDNQLIRQTESELISQGLVVAEAYRERLRREVDAEYGVARVVATAAPEDGLAPILPSLRASDPVRPRGLVTGAPSVPEARAALAGASLSPLLARVTRSTLSAIQVVDFHGVVVASSNAEPGANLRDWEEVNQALLGAPASLMRERVSDSADAPLESLSRNAGVRVFVALPIVEGKRVWGAVLLSRSPMTLAKAVYADRWNLTPTGLVLLGVTAVVSLLGAAFIVRPVRALVRQTRAIAENEPSGFQPIANPVISELAELSDSLASMAVTLRDRGDYIRSFAANVSHEFKTPLASIQGAIELLRDSEQAMAPEQRERFLRNIEADAKRLTQLVRRLLDLARADASGPSREMALMSKVMDRLRAEPEHHAVVLPAEVPDLSVRCPEDVLVDVVTQLIANARQHGGANVRVEVRVEHSGLDEVRVVVQDDGAGISESNRAQIFNAFFTTARERGGTGLGLTIARSMLRAVGAKLELLPAGKQGAEFAILLARA
jgi:signal transduction histidine kinase